MFFAGNGYHHCGGIAADGVDNAQLPRFCGRHGRCKALHLVGSGAYLGTVVGSASAVYSGRRIAGPLFARIPVSQVFRRYTEGKKGWKRPLLFVQFAGVAVH